MRFILAFVALLLGVVCLASGLAQRTFLLPPSEVSASVKVPGDARYIVLPASALQVRPGQAKVEIQGNSTISAAYGSVANITSWLHGQRYADVNLNTASSKGSVQLKTAPALAAVEATSAVNPKGSDLWLDEHSSNQLLNWDATLGKSTALLISSNGLDPAPASIKVTWPTDDSTPWVLPLTVGGGILIALGLLLYALALLRLRSSRDSSKTSGTAARVAAVRSARTMRGRAAALSTIAVVALLGGTVAATPANAATTPAAATASLTETQAERIVREVSLVANRADSTLDATLLATRFTGPALAIRETGYKLKEKTKSTLLPQALPMSATISRLMLPEATAAWPRTLFAVVASTDTKIAPLALTIRQDSPRGDYKVVSSVSLLPNSDLPTLPAITKGGTRLANNSKVLTVAPGDIANDYGSLLRDVETSKANLFDTATDELYAEVGPAVKKKIMKALGSTADIVFTDQSTDPTNTIATSTAESGAVVSVYVEEIWTVKPNRKGVTVKPSGQTAQLSGVKSTSKGVASTYSYQLLFSVPAAGSNDKVQLLGFAEGLLSAKGL